MKLTLTLLFVAVLAFALPLAGCKGKDTGTNAAMNNAPPMDNSMGNMPMTNTPTENKTPPATENAPKTPTTGPAAS